jgi:ABC-2 type transport system ATP-binding protein
MTGFENLWQLARMEEGITESELMEAVSTVGMQARIHDSVHTYSLGMKQRLGIAQAMMKKPELLILDEPTNGLDPAGIREFRELVRFLARDTGLTMLISSHLLSEVQLMCDEVAIILHGRIINTLKVDDLHRQQRVTWTVLNPDRAFDVLSHGFPQLPILRTTRGLSAVVDSDLLPEINDHLVRAETGLLEVCRHQKTLEDLFMELTGGETIG